MEHLNLNVSSELVAPYFVNHIVELAKLQQLHHLYFDIRPNSYQTLQVRPFLVELRALNQLYINFRTHDHHIMNEFVKKQTIPSAWKYQIKNTRVIFTKKEHQRPHFGMSKNWSEKVDRK